jgi:hypothetical protein
MKQDQEHRALTSIIALLVLSGVVSTVLIWLAVVFLKRGIRAGDWMHSILPLGVGIAASIAGLLCMRPFLLLGYAAATFKRGRLKAGKGGPNKAVDPTPGNAPRKSGGSSED